ncbi:MAG TPA: hypothetical protein PKI88_01580 [Agitococcus sp.]|nr:hypothetical protein [Agitococcus sp.]HNL35783.1 hypothetical protein [Agitococcus sp.]
MWQSGRRQRLKSYLNSPITQHLLAWSLVAILGLVVNAIGFFYWGYDYGLRSIGASANEVQQLRQQVKQQNQQIPLLQQQLAIAQQNLDIAQKTSQQLQQDNKSQLASVADMQEQIMVYQRLLGTKGAANALNIDSFNVQRLTNGSYQYRVLLTQPQNNKQNVRVIVKIIPNNKQAPVILQSEEQSFQFFKSITGEFVLPSGFVVDSVEVTIQGVGKKAIKLQKRFKWDL